jgi:mevalonate kinase
MNNLPDFAGPKPLPFGERLERGFPSKLLLFGEYGLMYDAMALSVPFPKFSGFLDFDPDHSHPESNAEIRKFYNHLKLDGFNKELHFSFDLPWLESDLEKGLFFHSSIPQQYGLGSSGALVAALFDKYAFPADLGNNLSPEILKANFVVLESFFHGKSSGFDPLVSYLNKPIGVGSQNQVIPVDFDLQKSGLAVALIDTKKTGATGPLVKHFLDLFNLPEFTQAFEHQFIPANNGCIESLLNGDQPNFFLHLGKLVRFQAYHFHEMIPAGFHRVISFAHCEKVYIKLLGSGGGGYLLAFAESDEVLDRWSKKRGIELMKVV